MHYAMSCFDPIDLALCRAIVLVGVLYNHLSAECASAQMLTCNALACFSMQEYLALIKSRLVTTLPSLGMCFSVDVDMQCPHMILYASDVTRLVCAPATTPLPISVRRRVCGRSVRCATVWLWMLKAR